MAFNLERVNSLLESNSVYELRDAESTLCDRLDKFPRVTQTKLCKPPTVTKTVKREVLVERDVTDDIENAVDLR